MTDSRKFKYIRLEDAIELIDRHVKCSLQIEEIDLANAYGRVLAEDIISKVDLPLYDMAHFDGYALRTSDVTSASPKSPVKLKVKAKIYPSTTKLESIGFGEAAYITTGSFMPVGADGILPVEAALVKGDVVEVKYAVKPGEHVIKAGSDVRRGECVLRRGHRLRGQDLALLALIGYGKVKVYSRPKVGILPIGDELTCNYGEVKVGKVPCGHLLMISSFVVRDGGIPISFDVTPDDIDAISNAISKAANKCDIILTISGASKGERDYVEDAIGKVDGGHVVFHGVMVKPGRQTGFALVKNKPLIMLPGLSHSTIVGYCMIARRALFRLMSLGEPWDKPLRAKMAMSFDLPPPKGFKRVVFMRVEKAGSDYLAWPIKGESALVSIPVRSHGYAVFDEGVERVNEGSIIDIQILY